MLLTICKYFKPDSLQFRLPMTSNLQIVKQVAQLSQRNRAAGWVSFGQKWKTGNGINYFADILGLSSTAVT